MNEIREEELNYVEEELKKIGITMVDAIGDYRPFNEVMIDLGRALKQCRNSMEQKEFNIFKLYVLRVICGARYMNEFMC
jgi:hypothetical protein